MAERWSVTAHRRRLACARMDWLVRVARVEQDHGDASNRGVVAHAGLAAAFREYLRAIGEPHTPGALRRRMEAAVDFAVSSESTRLDYDEVDEAYETVTEALRHLGPQPGDQILGVELPMVITVDGVEIIYWADLVYRRDGLVVLRDWKSSSEVPRARDLPTNDQLGLGALCVARTFDVTRVSVEIASIARAVAVSAPMSAATAHDTAARVAATARAAAADITFAPTPGPVCADCRVRRHCPVKAPVGVPIPTPGSQGQPVMTGVIEV